LAHGKDLLEDSVTTTVVAGMDGRNLHVPRSKTAQRHDDEGDVEPISTDSDSDNDSNAEERILAPLDMDDFADQSGPTPMHSRKNLIPVYEVGRHLPSHFVWNCHYGVMRRTSRYSCTRTNAIIEHIAAMSGDASVSLLYPEAQIMPRIFWNARSNSVVGAIPSCLLNVGSKYGGIADLSQHQYVRIRDGDILTSRECGYWHYMFDLQLNTQLNSVPAAAVMRRGPEFLLEPRGKFETGQCTIRSELPMNDVESTRRVKELASLLKKGKWHFS